MPKFSQQRIIKSKLILSSYLTHINKDQYKLEEIADIALNKTKMLLNEDDPNFNDFLESNYHLLINSSIKMTVPKIRNQFESGYALFYPDDSVIKVKEEKRPSFYVFNENEMINYAINRHKTFLYVKSFRKNVIRFYSRFSNSYIMNKTNLSEQDLMDEIEYAKSMSGLGYVNESCYMLDALINCNKIVDFMKAVLDDDCKNDSLYKSLKNPAYIIDEPIAKVKCEGNIYYIIPIIEDFEINSMEKDYVLKLKK